MKLLALDTATDLCSAALWLEGALTMREALAPRLHGTLILTMIDELLGEAGLSLHELQAIAFGRGPGAFTGLRLAAATAQGLGFAVGRPLIPVSDLRALAQQALAVCAPEQALGRVLICQDARMGEVYWGCFERRAVREPLRSVGAEQVSAPEAVGLPAEWLTDPAAPGAGVYGAGSGFSAYELLRTRFAGQLGALQPELYPRAREIAQLAAEDGLDASLPAEQALPVYLRDRVTTVTPRVIDP